MRVDGYGGDPIDDEARTLSLIVSDFSNKNEVEVINRADVEILIFSKKSKISSAKSQDGTIFSEIL